jgi:hypothetical protein
MFLSPQRRKMRWYNPYYMTTEPPNYVTFEYKHYDIMLKCFYHMNFKTKFLLRFTKLDDTVNYTPGLAPQRTTSRRHSSPRRSHVVVDVEVIIHWK